MSKLLEEITIEEFFGDSYIIKFPIEFFDNGYSFCNDVARQLNNFFPDKKFCWIPNYLTFEEYSASMLEAVIEELTDILKNKRTEQENIGDVNERVGNASNEIAS